MGKCPNRIPIENFGQYYTIRINTWQYLAIFDDIEQYLNVPYNVTTRVSWNSHLNNIKQYRTLLGNIYKYCAILGNIGQYLGFSIILDSICQYCSISKAFLTIFQVIWPLRQALYISKLFHLDIFDMLQS